VNQKTDSRKQWIRYIKLAGAFVLLICISVILAYFFQRFMNSIDLPLDKFSFLAYLVVFAITLVAHLFLVAPVPIAVPVMITVAANFDPLLTALAAALGGSVGELSTYFIGYAGRKLTVANNIIGFQRVEGWINRWGPWAIVFLAFQPIIPLDIGGLAAGAARMPLIKFLPALFAGKFPKYLLMIYIGLGVINFLPDGWF